MNSYPPGNVIRLTATALTAGTPADVGAMTCTYLPQGATAPTTVPAVHDGPGQYHADIGPLEQPGTYLYAFKATGSGAAATESQLFIRQSVLL